VTATVESIPLITASILSKKLAAGLQGLVMDVKTGRGAFAESLEDSLELARSIVQVAEGAGLPTSALITDMNQVLGRTAGNGIEVREAIDYLTGATRDPRLHEVVSALAEEMLLLGRLASDPESARAKVQQALERGAAAERFARMVTGLGGPADLMDQPERHLPRAAVEIPAPPARPGVVTAMDTRAVGLAVVALGGGRLKPDDSIDYAVGLSGICALGETVGPDRPLATVHARNDDDGARATAVLQAAITVGDTAPVPSPIIHERVAGAGR
jgi:thymidine phosphorylase